MLTGAFLIILLSLAAIIPPLRYNKFYILNTALVVGSAYLFENNVYVIKNIFNYKIMKTQHIKYLWDVNS